jgi:signal peptidase II
MNLRDPESEPRPNPAGDVRYRCAYGLLLSVAFLIVVADQASKSLASAALSNGRVIGLFGDHVLLDLTRNTGAAFSLFRTGGSLFIGLAVVISAGILVMYRRVAQSALVIRLGLGMVLGGAVGNLIDRVRLGYVVDFIDLRWWPVFNVADSAIVVGVLLLMLASFWTVPDSEND